MGSARINAIRQRLAQSDLDWDDIFIRSGEIGFEKDWASEDKRETEWKWNYEEEYPGLGNYNTEKNRAYMNRGREHPNVRQINEGNEYWTDKAGKRRKTEGRYVDVGPSDKRLYEFNKYYKIPQLQDSFKRKGLVPSEHKFPDFSQGIEGLKGADYGFMSPKGMWFSGNVLTEYEGDDFDELDGADSLTEWLNSAKEAGLINEQTVEKYSMEDGVLDFYEDTGFGMTKGSLNNMDSNDNVLSWDSPRMPTPLQTATFKKMIETNNVNPENVHTNIWSGKSNDLFEVSERLKKQGDPNAQFRKALKLKKYKPIYTDIQGNQVTLAAYKRITESGIDPMSSEYGYDPQDPHVAEALKNKAEHPEDFPSAEQMENVRKQGLERKEESKKRHYKQRAKKYGGKSARIEALRQRMAYDPPEEDILGSSILEKADAFEIHKQPHTIPPSRLMKKNIHAKDKIGVAFENFLGGDDVNEITGEEYKSQLDEIIRKGYIGENVDRTKKYRLDRTNKLPHQRTKDVAQGFTRDYIQKHKLAKLRQRLALTGNIKKYNKDYSKKQIREDTIAELGIFANPPVSAELGLERYKKRGKRKRPRKWDYGQDKSSVFQKGEPNIRDVDNPIIGESKRWNKKERDIIKTHHKGDRISNIRGPNNKYGLTQREMKNLKLHLDKGKANPDYSMGITQKHYDKRTTRPRYPKEKIVEQMGLFGPIKDNLWRDDPTGADMITNFDEMVKNSPPVENISDIVYKDVHELDDPDRYAKQRIAYTGGSHYDEAITRLQKDWEGMEKGIYGTDYNCGLEENCGLSTDTIIKKLKRYGLDPGDPEENDPDFKGAEMWRENGNYTGPGMERSRGYSEVNRFEPIEDGQPGVNVGSGVGHAWVRLDDGTIIDGSSGQFMGKPTGPEGQRPNTKHRNRLRIIPPNSKLQQYYEADLNDLEERFYGGKSARIQMARERLALIDRPNYKRPGEWFVGDIQSFEKHLKKYEKVKGKRRIPSERVSFNIVDNATFSQRSPTKKSPFHKRMMRLNKDRKNIPKDQKILNRKREVFPEHRDLTPNFQKKHEVGSDELGFTNKEAERLTGNRSNYHGSFSKLRQRIGRLTDHDVEISHEGPVTRRKADKPIKKFYEEKHKTYGEDRIKKIREEAELEGMLETSDKRIPLQKVNKPFHSKKPFLRSFTVENARKLAKRKRNV